MTSHTGIRNAVAMVLMLSMATASGAHHAKGHGARSERLPEAAIRHSLRPLQGRPISLESLRGEVVVVNFWASWCAPCRKELPRLEALHAELAKHGGRVLAVSVDHELGNVKRFVKKHGLSLPVCHDGPEGLARLIDLEHVPFTIVLDRSGTVAFASDGADRGALDRLQAVSLQLAKAPPAMAKTAEGTAP